MREKVITFQRVLITNTVAIIVATAIAIDLHSIVPADVNVEEFNYSPLVMWAPSSSSDLISTFSSQLVSCVHVEDL